MLTHAYITKRDLGEAPGEGDVASLRVFMASLRKKIEKDPAHPEYIQTHVGSGIGCCASNIFSAVLYS